MNNFYNIILSSCFIGLIFAIFLVKLLIIKPSYEPNSLDTREVIFFAKEYQIDEIELYKAEKSIKNTTHLNNIHIKSIKIDGNCLFVSIQEVENKVFNLVFEKGKFMNLKIQ